MCFIEKICVLILTFNEAPNIARTLRALRDFREIIVVDSGSDDGTQAIVETFPNTRLLSRKFDSHSQQWNFGLAQCNPARPWTLALDADYVVSEALVAEILALCPEEEVAGYRTAFEYWLFGRPLRGNLYPATVTLFRRAKAHYVQTGHTQRVIIDGAIDDLKQTISHDDRKALSRWFTSQQKYARLEAQYLLSCQNSHWRISDRVRRLAGPAPFFVFAFTLFGKGCVMDGSRGWFYALQRTLVEIMIALELIEQRQSKARGSARQ